MKVWWDELERGGEIVGGMGGFSVWEEKWKRWSL